MKTVSTKASSRTARKPAAKSRTKSVLSICPVDGAGWCPYPFSPAQLAKRLKAKAESSASPVAAPAASRRTSKGKGK